MGIDRALPASIYQQSGKLIHVFRISSIIRDLRIEGLQSHHMREEWLALDPFGNAMSPVKRFKWSYRYSQLDASHEVVAEFVWRHPCPYNVLDQSVNRQCLLN